MLTSHRAAIRDGAGAGKIVRPTTDEMFFLPQRPYCTLGPLRDQITYPSSQLDDDADAVGGEDKDIDSTKQDRLHGASGSGAEDDELLSLLEKVRWVPLFAEGGMNYVISRIERLALNSDPPFIVVPCYEVLSLWQKVQGMPRFDRGYRRCDKPERLELSALTGSGNSQAPLNQRATGNKHESKELINFNSCEGC